MPCPCTYPPKDNRPCSRVEDDVRHWRISSLDVAMLAEVGIVSEPSVPWPVERFDDDD